MRRKHLQVLLICCLLLNIGIILTMSDLSVASPDQPTVAVDPKISSVAPGGFFTINVTVSDLTSENAQPAGLLAWQANITFSPDILNVSAVAEGPFLDEVASAIWVPSTIDNDNGFVLVAASLFPPPAEGAYGSGVLANITFQVENEGQTNLDFDNETTMLRSGDGIQSIAIPHSTVGGTFRYPVLRDVAVTGVTFSPSSVPAGGTVSINVTVENEGNAFDETFDVSVSFDSSLIGTKTVTDLAPGASQIVSFSWDTGGITEGSYTITAVAATVPDENETADNTYPSGNTVTITTSRDVAVTGVTFSPSSVPAGGTVSINVTVENEGNAFDETFDVSVSFDSSLIGTKTVTDLAPGASQIVSFSWDTNGVAEGSYTIKATATTVPEETETGDNTYESSNTVEVTAPQTTLPVELVIGAIVVIAIIGVGSFFLLKRRSAKT